MFLRFLISSAFLMTSCQKSNRFGEINRSDSGLGLLKTPNASENQSVIRKNNLESLAVGRNRMEIEHLMGPPEGKSLDGGNGYLWDYRRAVYDDTTDKVYSWSLISFKFLQGRCAYINFQLEDLPAELLVEQDGRGNSSLYRTNSNE